MLENGGKFENANDLNTTKILQSYIKIFLSHSRIQDPKVER